jgi:hypothetical protein
MYAFKKIVVHIKPIYLNKLMPKHFDIDEKKFTLVCAVFRLSLQLQTELMGYLGCNENVLFWKLKNWNLYLLNLNK